MSSEKHSTSRKHLERLVPHLKLQSPAKSRPSMNDRLPEDQTEAERWLCRGIGLWAHRVGLLSGALAC
jgi:hypothetical protein